MIMRVQLIQDSLVIVALHQETSQEAFQKVLTTEQQEKEREKKSLRTSTD